MLFTYANVRRLAFFLLTFPCLVFFIGFLRPLIAIPLSLLLCLAVFLIARERGACEEPILGRRWQLLALFFAALLWCWLAGIGNLYYQSADYAARNAVFRDLITFKWPVLYPNKNSALVYYIGFWLPAALVGKCLLPVGEKAAFLAGNLALLLWATLCVFTVFLLLAHLVRAKTGKHLALAVVIFIFFSGLDLLGTLCNAAFMGHAMPDHFEWWAFYFQFSSNTTALFWVFNQAIPSFLATLLFLTEKRLRAFGLILGGLLCASPFACVGLFLLMLVRAVAARGGKTVREWLLDLLSIPNLIALLLIAPVFLLYYKTNVAFSMTKLPHLEGRHVFLLVASALLLILAFVGYALLARRARAPRPALCFGIALLLFLCVAPLIFSRAEPIYYSFLLLECGVYLALLYPDHSKEPLYYALSAVLVLCPLFVIGTSVDFSMRASLPALCVLCVLCICSLLSQMDALRCRSLPRWRRPLFILLCTALAIGAATPVMELVRGLSAVIEHGTLLVINDSYGTMSQIFPNGIGSTDKNFIAYAFGDTFFFKYLAKGVG